MASADCSCPDAASSTDRPDSSRDLPIRQLCPRMSVSDTLCRASEIVRPFSSGPRYSRSAKISGGDILVDSDELADGRREGGILRDGERIDPEIVLQPRDQDSERQRIEPGSCSDRSSWSGGSVTFCSSAICCIAEKILDLTDMEHLTSQKDGFRADART